MINFKNKIFFIGILFIFLSSCESRKKSISQSANQPISQSANQPISQSMYVSYNADNKENNKFTIFVKDLKTDKFYYGFEVGLEIDTSDIVYSHQYRLKKAELYKFENLEMIQLPLSVLTNGENEFVYKAYDKVDFTGGYHGDEKLIEINFFVDNKFLNLNTSFNLLPCKNFRYEQLSTTHETASLNNGINKSHPIESIHKKITSFGNSGFKTTNIINWKKDLKIEKIYGSLVCLSRDFGELGWSTNLDTIKFDASGNYKLKSKDNNMIIHNTFNKTKTFINSNFSNFNSVSTQFIWDHKNYNKYYRNTGAVNVKNNDIWEFSTEVQFETYN